MIGPRPETLTEASLGAGGEIRRLLFEIEAAFVKGQDFPGGSEVRASSSAHFTEDPRIQTSHSSLGRHESALRSRNRYSRQQVGI
jgi:hypothetical protein